MFQFMCVCVCVGRGGLASRNRAKSSVKAMKTQLELIGRISWSSGCKNQIWELFKFDGEDSLLGQNNKHKGSVGARVHQSEK